MLVVFLEILKPHFLSHTGLLMPILRFVLRSFKNLIIAIVVLYMNT